MSKQLSACSYLILIMINTFIGLIASYSLGLFHGNSERIDKVIDIWIHLNRIDRKFWNASDQIVHS